MEEKFELPSEDLKVDMDKRHESLLRGELYCNFCGKKQTEVKHLVAGPNVYICDQCIVLCVYMLREHNPGFCQDIGSSVEVKKDVAVQEHGDKKADSDQVP